MIPGAFFFGADVHRPVRVAQAPGLCVRLQSLFLRVAMNDDGPHPAVDDAARPPAAFATFVHYRYRSELIDTFAGRVYETEHQPSNAILQFRKLLKRERTYTHADDYSIPIGSRYHPERAPLWAPDSPVEGTEEWLERSKESGGVSPQEARSTGELLNAE